MFALVFIELDSSEIKKHFLSTLSIPYGPNGFTLFLLNISEHPVQSILQFQFTSYSLQMSNTVLSNPQ